MKSLLAQIAGWGVNVSIALTALNKSNQSAIVDDANNKNKVGVAIYFIVRV